MACNNKDLLLIIVLSGEWVLCWFLLSSLFHVVVFQQEKSPGLEGLRRPNSHVWQLVLTVLGGNYICLHAG